MIAGIVGVASYAAGNDSYYGGGVSRWDHAAQSGGTGLLIVLFAIPSVIALAVLATGLLRRRHPPAWVLASGIVLYSLPLLYAWLGLTLGH